MDAVMKKLVENNTNRKTIKNKTVYLCNPKIDVLDPLGDPSWDIATATELNKLQLQKSIQQNQLIQQNNQTMMEAYQQANEESARLNQAVVRQYGQQLDDVTPEKPKKRSLAQRAKDWLDSCVKDDNLFYGSNNKGNYYRKLNSDMLASNATVSFSPGAMWKVGASV